MPLCFAALLAISLLLAPARLAAQTAEDTEKPQKPVAAKRRPAPQPSAPKKATKTAKKPGSKKAVSPSKTAQSAKATKKPSVAKTKKETAKPSATSAVRKNPLDKDAKPLAKKPSKAAATKKTKATKTVTPTKKAQPIKKPTATKQGQSEKTTKNPPTAAQRKIAAQNQKAAKQLPLIQQEIQRALDRADAGFAIKDVNQMLAAATPDFVAITESGRKINLRDYRAAYAKLLPGFASVESKTRVLGLTVKGTTASVTATTRARIRRIQRRGSPLDTTIEGDEKQTWVKKDGKWRVRQIRALTHTTTAKVASNP